MSVRFWPAVASDKLTHSTGVPCDYGCIFGISGPCKGIEPGMLNSVFREKDSFLVNGGPEHRVYWFYFFKLPEKLYGADIPRFSKEDEAKLLDKLREENILPTLKFGELVDKTITSNMTALPEYIYSRWYYERILTIGDASHKVRRSLSAKSARMCNVLTPSAGPSNRRPWWERSD